ncbi:MAG TPA: FtsX-like permease family protein [Verrucomicrobiae bacterium]|nr:FtsX-like permease family protein [Verrucomicrobiae bacterium]
MTPPGPASRNGFAGFFRALAQPWTWRMAWRDSRSSRRRLMVFSLSIVLGVAALVAIGSLSRNLHDAIDEQAKTLLGADLAVTSRSPFTPEQENLFVSLGGEQSRETSFSSMAYFPKTADTRLVQVRALEGRFPFYGNLDTAPPDAPEEFRAGNGALVEDTLLAQFNARPGDEIKLGEERVKIAGSLRKVPGESFAFANFAPRVYLPMARLSETGLLKKGSVVRYRAYFRLPPKADIAKEVARIKPELEKARLSFETVQKRKEDLGESMNNLYRFLNLAGFIALLLGGVGIASAVQMQVQQKLGSAAVLRCLGCPVSQTFAIYFIQATALGLAGVLVGTTLGLLIEQAIPRLAARMFPFPVAFTVHWWPVVRAMAVSLGISWLFALFPLLAVRRVTPLAVLRGSGENTATRDPWRWVVGIMIFAAVAAFAVAQSDKWYHGLAFAGGLAVTFGVLLLVAKLIAWAARRAARPAWPYVWRQGLANLYRPRNRTVLLMVSLGLGTFLILTLYLLHSALLTELIPDRDGNRPNAILFDVQVDQREALGDLLRAGGFPVLNQAPVVTMRLQSIKGQPVEDLLKDKSKRIPGWALRREYRSTYRDHLMESETLLSGAWEPRADTNAVTVPVSIEADMARDLKVGIGDAIVFDVQGVPVTTRVASVRKVDWRRVQSNFYFVFPLGVLESAPNFFIFTTRVNSAIDSARMQRAVVEKFPNVSIIDLTLVLQTLDGIIEKITVVVRCMSLFTVATGFLVLTGAVLTGRYQRIQESILLRTLGASRRQVLQILFAEYLLLGVFASLTGVILATAASWALARFVFDISFTTSPWPFLVTTAIVSTITVLTGLGTSLGVTRRPPLEILRAES